MNPAHPPFVKKFDFRGVYGKDLLDTDAYYLALALKELFPLHTVLLGWDTRSSSKTLAFNFMQALKDTDIKISYLDRVPIDYVTAAADVKDFDLSIMFTGSHNTWEWTGLLIHTKGGDSLQGELVEKVVEKYNEVKNAEYVAPDIDLSQYTDLLPEIEKIYTEKIKSIIPVAEIRPLTVAVDIGDGSGSKSLSILEKLLPQVSFTRVNDRQVYDADTPHQADPSEIEHMQQLIDTVKTKSLHCGFAFDSDADRVLAIDEKGGYINGSLYAGALVDVMSILNCKLDAVGYAVEIGPAFYNTVADLNISVDKKIKISPIPVGRSIVRQLVREDSVDLGIENVGHFYIYDFFRTDSGAFALLMMLYWMSLNGKLSKLYTRHPDGQRAQGSVPLSDENETKIHTLVNEIKNHFATNEVRLIDVDGVRLEIYNGGKMQSWCAVRKSGYEKKEKYYFGSTDPSDFEYLTEQFNLFANSSRSA